MRAKWSLCGLLVMAASCSANGGGGGGGLSPTGVDCAALCARLDGAPNCATTASSECNASCAHLVAGGGATCGAQLDALSACATAAPVRCVGTGLNPFTGCNAQFVAAVTCASSRPQDAGP